MLWLVGLAKCESARPAHRIAGDRYSRWTVVRYKWLRVPATTTPEFVSVPDARRRRRLLATNSASDTNRSQLTVVSLSSVGSMTARSTGCTMHSTSPAVNRLGAKRARLRPSLTAKASKARKKRLSWPSRVVSLSYDLMWGPTPQGWRAAPQPSAASALTRRAQHQWGFS
jgi:hypothetical protein